MEEKEVQIQEFNNEDYFLYDTAITDNSIYNIFSKVSNPKEFKIVKEVVENDEIFYEELDDIEYEYALSLFYKEEQ